MGLVSCLLFSLLAAAAAENSEQNYIGCYKDTEPDRALPSDYVRTDTLTPQFCLEHCMCKGHDYAGVQYGKECWCGTNYDKYGPADNCDLKCTGDSSQICGGHWANSVYTAAITECPDPNGLYKDPCDLTMYYHCSNGTPHHQPCPEGLCWNDDEKACDWPDNVPGCPA